MTTPIPTQCQTYNCPGPRHQAFSCSKHPNHNPLSDVIHPGQPAILVRKTPVTTTSWGPIQGVDIYAATPPGHLQGLSCEARKARNGKKHNFFFLCKFFVKNFMWRADAPGSFVTAPFRCFTSLETHSLAYFSRVGMSSSGQPSSTYASRRARRATSPLKPTT